MNSAPTFIPPVATARAHSAGRFRIGFGTRFFVALLIGLVWVVPAAWSPRLIAGMFVWDGLFLLLWLQDLLRLPKPGELELRRVWHSPPSLGVRSKVSVELHNFGRRAVFARVTDETSRALRREPPVVELAVPAGGIGERRVRNSSGAARRPSPSANCLCAIRARCAWPSAGPWRKPRRACAFSPISNKPSSRRCISSARARSRWSGGAGACADSAASLKACANTGRATNSATSAGRPRRAARNSSRACFKWSAARPCGSCSMPDAFCASRLCGAARPLRLSKLDYAVDAALALAQVAMHSGDRVGLARLRPRDSAELQCRSRRVPSALDRRVSRARASRAVRSRSRPRGPCAAHRATPPQPDRVDHRSRRNRRHAGCGGIRAADDAAPPGACLPR